jgi:hypothetical protein
VLASKQIGGSSSAKGIGEYCAYEVEIADMPEMTIHVIREIIRVLNLTKNSYFYS